MITLGLDFETTGLNPEGDRVLEVGAALYSTGQKKVLESAGYLVKSSVPVSEHVTAITGITQSAVDKFGYESKDALEALLDLADQADAFLGQNVVRFDKRFLENWARREGLAFPNKLWIDSRTDLPGTEGKHLNYMAADEGFLNLFPHSALTDVLTVIKLTQRHDFNKIVERAQSPTVVLLGHQKREDNNLAKARKFSWNGDYRVWWKTVKQLDVEAEVVAAKFDISFAPPEILIEKLWYGN
ncbi:MAG: 3'-5' exonuclease [Thaumarchaeota archaeon]|nr:3'-5' exonuclease [Nitrososphaerota archaeon]